MAPQLSLGSSTKQSPWHSALYVTKTPPSFAQAHLPSMLHASESCIARWSFDSIRPVVPLGLGLETWHLLPHVIVVLLAFGIWNLFGAIQDRALGVFIALITWRYFRFFVLLFFFWRYKPATIPATGATSGPKDVTIIIPALSVSDNPDFEECVTSCLVNRPAALHIITDTEAEAAMARDRLRLIRERVQGGTSCFTPGEIDISNVETRATHAGIANKRYQMEIGFSSVRTRLTLCLDDHVFIGPSFLSSAILPFEDPDVGLCGTKKRVRRKQPGTVSCWQRYCELFWNVMGALYLARHNFEIRATNASDGGVFVVSGRAFVIRSEIIRDIEFAKAFTNERFFFGCFGPLNPDDDNFITRWVAGHPKGYKIKIQYTDDATIETTLGEYPRFLSQCPRWARTTYRSNCCSLITDRIVWWRWPWTVWTAYIPSLFNPALFWDPSIIYALTRTSIYSESRHPTSLLVCLGAWIYFTKLAKLMDHFWHHPSDFPLFFFPIPAYHVFAYCHSIIKLWAALTFWDHSWSGRNLAAKEGEEVVMREAELGEVNG